MIKLNGEAPRPSIRCGKRSFAFARISQHLWSSRGLSDVPKICWRISATVQPSSGIELAAVADLLQGWKGSGEEAAGYK